jgi:hypothetical protein
VDLQLERIALRAAWRLAPAVVVVGAVLLVVIAGPAPARGAPPYQVIVNEANPVKSLDADTVSRLFLKKTTTWDDASWENGGKVLPVDRRSDSAVREEFTREVHQRSVAAVKSYWQQMIFSGRDVPPPEKDSAAEVIEFVRANPGAIGYIESSVGLPTGVKRLRISE